MKPLARPIESYMTPFIIGMIRDRWYSRYDELIILSVDLRVYGTKVNDTIAGSPSLTRFSLPVGIATETASSPLFVIAVM